MVATTLLFGLLLIATLTDICRHKIYNWTTYCGMLLGVGSGVAVSLGAYQAMGGPAMDGLGRGLVSLPDSLLGLATCGAIMVIGYVFFPGGVGGGDVKLMAMIGACWGPAAGLEVLLWTLIFGGSMALAALAWRMGPTAWLVRSAMLLWTSVQLGPALAWKTHDRRPLQIRLPLAPCALLAAVIWHWALV